jgi:hypothetical protein
MFTKDDGFQRFSPQSVILFILPIRSSPDLKLLQMRVAIKNFRIVQKGQEHDLEENQDGDQEPQEQDQEDLETTKMKKVQIDDHSTLSFW